MRPVPIALNRIVRIPVTVACLTCVVWAGGAPGQTAPPTTTAAQGAGRGGFVPVPVVIGPPAPVPPEVAIPRPTSAELVQVNDAVKRFIDRDTSSTKPLLRKFEPLLMLQPARKNVAATFTQTVQRQGPRHQGFVEVAKQGNIDLLLHGDSTTDWWVQGEANRAMFDKYFGGMRTANFAIAGDTTQGVLWGLANGEGQGFQPKAVMVMIGTNNGSNTGPEIAEGVGAVVLEMRKEFPNAKIPVAGDLPPWGARRSDPRQDCRGQPDHFPAGRSEKRLLPRHRREIPGREGRLPAGHLQAGQSRPGGQGIRHLGRGGQREAGRTYEAAVI